MSLPKPASIAVMSLTNPQAKLNVVSRNFPFASTENVQRGYRELANHEPNRWIRIDGSRDPKEVAQDVWQHVSEFFDL